MLSNTTEIGMDSPIRITHQGKRVRIVICCNEEKFTSDPLKRYDATCQIHST